MAKPMNHKRRLRASEKATPSKGSNPVALAMILRTGSGAGKHPDRRKAAARKACRGKVAY